MKIRALIVDDEAPARELIATLLRGEPDVEVVGECANGRSAVIAIERSSPDLVFLDIQMPGLDGFGVLAELPQDRWPLVVFVTAYDQHAIRAFEVHALDYLLKPFEYDRLRQAVERARAQLSQGNGAAQQERLMTLLENLQRQAGSWDRIAVREAGRVIFLKPEEIDWIEAAGNYLRLHVGKKFHLLRETMNSAETRLREKKFLRVNRSVLVNLERVKEWQPLFHGDSVVILEDRTRLTVSRGYREKLDGLVARLN
jgi:two-component system, LytTR family, response regulator